MLLLVFVASAQAISPAPADTIDLTVAPRCEASQSTSGEVVVCARRRDERSPYRLPLLPSKQGAGVPKAEAKLGNGANFAAETEQADIGGFPSNRLMLRLKFKF